MLCDVNDCNMVRCAAFIPVFKTRPCYAAKYGMFTAYVYIGM